MTRLIRMSSLLVLSMSEENYYTLSKLYSFIEICLPHPTTLAGPPLSPLFKFKKNYIRPTRLRLFLENSLDIQAI